jgi:hypothetical protein
MHGIMSRVKGVFVVKRQLEGLESRSLTPDARRIQPIICPSISRFLAGYALYLNLHEHRIL